MLYRDYIRTIFLYCLQSLNPKSYTLNPKLYRPPVSKSPCHCRPGDKLLEGKPELGVSASVLMLLGFRVLGFRVLGFRA